MNATEHMVAVSNFLKRTNEIRLRLCIPLTTCVFQREGKKKREIEKENLQVREAKMRVYGLKHPLDSLKFICYSEIHMKSP